MQIQRKIGNRSRRDRYSTRKRVVYPLLHMFKLKTFALGLLTLISLAPSAQATPLFDRGRDNYPTPVQRPVINRNAQPEIKVIVNPQSRLESRYENRRGDEYRYRQEVERRRQFEIAREREIRERIAREREIRERIAREQAEREARARWEAKHRRHGGYYPPTGGYGDYNSVYRR